MTAPFEGAEKALEVVVADGTPSLRALGDAYMRTLVAVADGTVLRRSETPALDAYLLAESSLFVSDRHLVMLTCGRTRLHRAAEKLVEDLGRAAIDVLSLTRLGERFPEAQSSSIAQDAARLAARLDGTFVRLGEHGPHRGGAFVHERPSRGRVPGETRLRIVGNDIDPDVARCFTGEARATQRGALARVLRHLGDGLHDAFDFAPSGYSLNAVDGTRTWALHVTPEPASSYVSMVASDADDAACATLVIDMLESFRPRTCLVTSEARVALPDAYRAQSEAITRLGERDVHVVEAALAGA